MERNRGDPTVRQEIGGQSRVDVHVYFFSFPRKVDELYVPKFFISSDYNLEDTLPHLGMSEVFTTQADLSGVTGARNLAVTQVSLSSWDNSPSVWEFE